MTKRSKHMLKTIVAVAIVVAFALTIFFVIRNSKRVQQYFLTPEQEQKIVDLLNERAEADPPTEDDITNLMNRVKSKQAE